MSNITENQKWEIVNKNQNKNANVMTIKMKIKTENTISN